MTSENLAQMMRQAKISFNGLWGTAVLGTLIYLLICCVASSISKVSLILSIVPLLVSGPLSYGYYLYIVKLVGTRNGDLNTLFACFNRFVDTMAAGIICSILTVIGLCLLIVPGVIIALGLSMTWFIMLDNPNISGVDALRESWRMMDGHKMDLFLLVVRFIGWILLVCITCGIAALWVEPYMVGAYLNFYRQLKYGTFKA